MFGGFGGVPRKPGKAGDPKLGIVDDKSKQAPQTPPAGAQPSTPSKVDARVDHTVAGPSPPVAATFSVAPAVVGANGRGPVPSQVVARVEPLRMGAVPEAMQPDARVESVFVGRPDAAAGKFTASVRADRVWRYWLDRNEFEQARREGRVGVKWVGPFFDESGYGEACRNYVAAVVTAGFPVSSRAITFGEPNVDYGRPGQMALATLNLGVQCAVNLVYAPPQHFAQHVDARAYNIGMFVWETNILPAEWVAACNRMDEIWVPCRWNAQVCAAAGVRRPIRVFGHCVSPEEYASGQPLVIPGLDAGAYKFYSVFQWSERKNPSALIRAYLSAFTDADRVVLIMKTYGANYSQAEEAKVRAEVERIRRAVGARQPKMMLITKILSKAQMLALHRLGDCFVLPHRSEGWGLPHFEASMTGRPVITTDYGGNLEFTKPEHSYLASYKPVPLRGMEWFKWYTADMTWADVDVGAVRDLMRHVHANKEEARAKGDAARRFVMENFTWKRIGESIKARLQEIVESL